MSTIKTGTYLDAMLIAENGLTPEMSREIFVCEKKSTRGGICVW